MSTPTPTPEMRRAVRVLARLARTLERTDTPLSLSQYRMLAMIAERSARSSSLAAELSLTKPTVSVAVEALQAQGLLTRHPDPEDRRAARVELTDAGREALAAAEAAQAARVAPLLCGTSDPDRLLALLGEVELRMDEARALRLAGRREVR